MVNGVAEPSDLLRGVDAAVAEVQVRYVGGQRRTMRSKGGRTNG